MRKRPEQDSDRMLQACCAFLQQFKTSFSCVLRTRPENDKGSGLQPSGNSNSRNKVAPLQFRASTACFAHWARQSSLPRTAHVAAADSKRRRCALRCIPRISYKYNCVFYFPCFKHTKRPQDFYISRSCFCFFRILFFAPTGICGFAF